MRKLYFLTALCQPIDFVFQKHACFYLHCSLRGDIPHVCQILLICLVVVAMHFDEAVWLPVPAAVLCLVVDRKVVFLWDVLDAVAGEDGFFGRWFGT